MTRKRMREQAEAISAGFALAKDNERLEAALSEMQSLADRLEDGVNNPHCHPDKQKNYRDCAAKIRAILEKYDG